MIFKKGQVTAFVIVGLIAVAIIFVLFLFNKGSVSLREQDFDNPEIYLSSCIRERARVVIDKMLIGGGFVDSTDKILFKSNEITYLCKNINNFEPCINQYPLYVSQLEKEFNKKIKEDAEQCFSSLKEELENRNYELTSSSNLIVEAKLKPEIVELVLKNDITISKSGESKKFSQFNTYIPTKLQGIGFVVNEIVNQEARWCHFSNDGFMLLYPEYDIRVYMMDETTKIYAVKNKKTEESLSMAVRGCALPAGWF